MKKIFFISILIGFYFTSCTEDIQLDIAAKANQIVVEGRIENGKVAEVIITKNSPLFSAVDLSNIIIKNALVYVSDGLITDTLTLDTVLTLSNPYAYTGKKIVGQIGQIYYLTVVVDGKTYTSQTSIPNLVALDSVWWKKYPDEDTLGFAYGFLSEPQGKGNAYQIQTKLPTKFYIDNGNPILLNRRFLTPFGGTFDDRFIDGVNFEFNWNKPTDPTESVFDKPDDNSFDNFFTKKDTIYVKFSTIDYSTYKFYSTYEQALQSNGNPFASPTTIISNIEGGALGVWAGFGATYDTIMPIP